MKKEPGKHSGRVPDALVAKMAEDYRRLRSLTAVGRIYGRSASAISRLLVSRGYKEKEKRAALVPEELVRQMVADYQTGMSLAAVGRKYLRDRRCVAELFSRRGYASRPLGYEVRRTDTGSFAKLQPHTEAEIEAMIQAATKLAVPLALKTEWRAWPLAKRGDFVRRLRTRLASTEDMRQLPFSSNVEPFDYGSERAHAIARKLNEGTNARNARVKLDLCSQGVIYREQLWFWCSKVGFQRGPWTQKGGRPSLHRVLWIEAYGPLPKDHALRFIDGNCNNLTLGNLTLVTRNEICRENQAAALLRSSRERTQLLLTRNQRKDKHHGPHPTIESLQNA